MTPTVLLDRVGHVAVLTLNRPDVLNAVNGELTVAAGAMLEQVAADRDLRVCVITGAGRAFCAGMDLKEFAVGRAIDQPGPPEWGFAGLARHRFDKPMIAAVNGIAVGGGAEIALACDLVVADENARFGFPEVTRGLFPAAGGSLRLAQQIPSKIAAELLLTGRPFSAVEAADWRLVNQIAPAGTALTAALELAGRIAENAPVAVQAVKRLMRDTVTDPSWTEPPWARIRAELEAVFASADAREGAAAFAQRRSPQWSGQ